MSNNTTSILSILPNFANFWNKRKKLYKSIGIPLKKESKWVVASDYCLEDLFKQNKTMTFTFFPYVSPEDMEKNIAKYLPTDIKNIRGNGHISEEGIRFLKEFPLFYSLCFVVENLDDWDIKEIKSDITRLCQLAKEKPNYFKVNKIQKFNQYLNRKKTNVNLIKYLYLVISIYNLLIEFLIIKEGAKKILIVSDRGKITDIANGIFSELLNLSVANSVKRRKTFQLSFYKDINDSKFFDSYIRIPDIITGTISSYNLITNEVDKLKHKEILVNTIASNDRIAIYKINIKGEMILFNQLNLTKI